MEIVVVVIFILGYLAITLEHNLKIDKLVPAVLMMGAAWAVVAVSHLDVFEITEHGKEASTLEAVLLHHFGKTCEILINQHNSEVPQDREALEALPGVGRKTANVVLNTAFGIPVMAGDTHIFRVSNRTKIAPGKNVIEVEKRLVRLIPKEYLLDAHHWLILLGRYTCTARKPKCGACLIEDLCEFKDKTEYSD